MERETSVRLVARDGKLYDVPISGHRLEALEQAAGRMIGGGCGLAKIHLVDLPNDTLKNAWLWITETNFARGAQQGYRAAYRRQDVINLAARLKRQFDVDQMRTFLAAEGIDGEELSDRQTYRVVAEAEIPQVREYGGVRSSLDPARKTAKKHVKPEPEGEVKRPTLEPLMF